MKTWKIVKRRVKNLQNSMYLQHSLIIAMKGLTTNIARSALTVLGIVIGITAIMLVMSLAKALKALFLASTVCGF